MCDERDCLLSAQIDEVSMSTKSYFIISIIAGLCSTGCSPEDLSWSSPKPTEAVGHKPREPVEVGDSLQQVEESLGDARIEFPDGDNMIHWIAGYEVTTSNQIVIAVNVLPTET